MSPCWLKVSMYLGMIMELVLIIYLITELHVTGLGKKKYYCTS